MFLAGFFETFIAVLQLTGPRGIFSSSDLKLNTQDFFWRYMT